MLKTLWKCAKPLTQKQASKDHFFIERRPVEPQKLPLYPLVCRSESWFTSYYMKVPFALLIVLLLTTISRAQSVVATTVHILNASGIGRHITFRTTTGKPITIRPQHWAIIQLGEADSLVLVTAKQSVAIPFERRKTYYFLANSDYTSAVTVSAKSEQEFLLSVQFNEAEKPDRYDIKH